jgi:hypothetical protein
VKHLLVATVIANTLLAAGCTSGDRSVSLDDLRKADAPYYYVGSSFEGFDVSHVQEYRDGEADILYGTCHVTASEGGCPLPLELQHRLCHGIVTVSDLRRTRRAKRQRPPSCSRPPPALEGSPKADAVRCVRQGCLLLEATPIGCHSRTLAHPKSMSPPTLNGTPLAQTSTTVQPISGA